ncbi:PAS domain S-box protein [Klebsiella pneumoniae subsp. pneumoniae]|nr:PAS domain S-box protein [Klebsiella pneumoniae subsp. pneumoniae]
MNRELPLIIILMLSTIAFTWLMRRGALIKAQINDENVFLLEQSRQALTASERRFRDVIEATTDWIWEADSEARLTWLSDRFSGVTGHHSDDWLGRNMLDFIHSDKILFHHWLLNPQTSSNYTLKRPAISQLRAISVTAMWWRSAPLWMMVLWAFAVR